MGAVRVAVNAEKAARLVERSRALVVGPHVQCLEVVARALQNAIEES